MRGKNRWKDRIRAPIGLALALALSLPNVQGQENPQQAHAKKPQVRDGDYLASHIAVSFAPLPSPWVSETNVMDPIWEPLGYKGVNFYAYGGPSQGSTFATRSDPDSPLYQAWFGVYVVAGTGGAFSGDEKSRACLAFSKLAEFDQRSWLEAMGDPHPLAESAKSRHFSVISIAGSDRTACAFDMKTHSDLGPGTTPLGKHLGMPPVQKWQDRLGAFHDLTLHALGAWWYDGQRGVTVIVYTASSNFTDNRGTTKDNGPAVGAAFHQMMSQVVLRDEEGAGR